ncbi:MAG TPA: D-2-hydroxyacid dehydrogenase, partial [Acetobacteraceae bacterium]|nr:D-2-hydroxyacid dehydrogenase [Acetobacteraceae bacterium]
TGAPAGLTPQPAEGHDPRVTALDWGSAMLPPKDQLTICFAHVAYQMQARFEARDTGIRCFQVNNFEDLQARVVEADVVSVSMMWRNELIERAARLRFIQSISAGIDQYDREKLAARGIRLASAAGVNANAVAQHAMALILALARRLPEARDNQAKRVWRGMISDLTQREDELGGQTLLIVGLGRIGGTLARLAKAFGMRVIATRRDPRAGGDADAVHGMDALPTLLPQADYVALTCPLTAETERLINATTLALMRPSASLVNVARGRCVDEPALIEALRAGRIVGAALDTTVQEPLTESSPLWAMPNVLITPHTAGETRRYEDNVIDILLDNLDRLWRGEPALRNQVI